MCMYVCDAYMLSTDVWILVYVCVYVWMLMSLDIYGCMSVCIYGFMSMRVHEGICIYNQYTLCNCSNQLWSFWITLNETFFYLEIKAALGLHMYMYIAYLHKLCNYQNSECVIMYLCMFSFCILFFHINCCNYSIKFH